MLKNKELSNKQFALISALIVTGLTFLAFGGQNLYSDIMTFAKDGDQMQLCYSSFVKLGRLLHEGVFTGVDSGSSNGATDFFLRGQIPVRYLPIMIMAYLGKYLGYNFSYMLFYVIHLLVALYCAQRLGTTYFQLSRYQAFLFACSCMPVMCHEMWYSSHAIVTFLTIPLLYFGLLSTGKIKRRYWPLLPMPYVLAFTAGYITLALVLVVYIWIVSVLYVFCNYRYEKNQTKKCILRLTLPLIVATIIVFFYYLSVLIYIKLIVRAGSYTLADAVAMKLNVINFAGIVFHSFNFIDGIEQLPIICIGIIWFTALIVIYISKGLKEISKAELLFCRVVIVINVILLVVSCGMNTPMGAWFYSIFPIIGQTHLPIRYMMITLPSMFLAFTTLFKYIDDGIGKKAYFVLAWACFGLALTLCFIFGIKNPGIVNRERFVLELFALAYILFVVEKDGWNSKRLIVTWSVYMIFIGVDVLYASMNITERSGEVESKCIVYNDWNKNELNTYLSEQPQSELYHFVHLDSTQSVTTYIPGNIEWFDVLDYCVTNYIGMDIHTCLPEDYRSSFSWFNVVDWEYLFNTRASFVIADQGSIDANEILKNTVQWENSNHYLNNMYRICTLKKYVPTYYTGGTLFVEDEEDTLDNGYFYCPNLKNSDLLDFKTDKSTYFKVKVYSPENNDLAFLLYPNANYNYYIDGCKIDPIIYKMQAFLSISAGEHTVEVKYVNPLDSIAVLSMGGYYIIFAISAVCLSAYALKRKKGSVL